MQKIFHPFDPFVLLFTLGMTFLGIWFLYKLIRWIEKLSQSDRDLLINGLFTVKTWKAILEVIRESLLHRKVFLTNKRLGYMHMSLAFGWFMLIVIGNVESIYYSGRVFKPIYLSVFWRFFDPGPPFPEAAFVPGLAFWMDFFLAFVLSGLLLVFLKRLRSIWLGMRHTTRQYPVDRIALGALWLIFPVRLLAESATCGANGTGSFLTGSLGHLMAGITDPSLWITPLWWSYSGVLMVFFIALPFTRYAHIPTEPVLIFLRKYGIRVSEQSPGYTDLSLHACSSCGICLDPCQLMDALPGRPIQSTYFVRSARLHRITDMQWECLQCGRCQDACPVGLELMGIRQGVRDDLSAGSRISMKPAPVVKFKEQRVLYFAGCMTHLTPSIIRSMQVIFEQASVSWQFYDAEGQSCCGRPLKLAGQEAGAQRVKEQLQSGFIGTGAELLVTSCPICYRMFREEYDLPGMTVLHHSEYILQLIEWKRLTPEVAQLAAAYHDPCELGRGCGVREEPKALIGKLFREDVTPQVNGLCCGGSLAAPALGLATRRAVARGAYTELTVGNPDVLITSCPLCKKTFDPVAGIPVLDIAEAAARMLQPATASLAHDSFSRSMATFEPCKTNSQPAYCLND